MIKKIVLIGLIIIGIMVILIPYKDKELIRKSISDNLEIYNNMTIDEYQKDNKGLSGILRIKDLNVELPIMDDPSESNLMKGAAQMKGNQVMGKGNYALAGHFMKDKTLLFGGLMDIKTGSIIELIDQKNVYEYAVIKTIVAEDTQTDMIDDKKSIEEGTPIVTLMTCYYSSKTGKRFFVIGRFLGTISR